MISGLGLNGHLVFLWDTPPPNAIVFVVRLLDKVGKPLDDIIEGL
jgi:hypothetical protein